MGIYNLIALIVVTIKNKIKMINNYRDITINIIIFNKTSTSKTFFKALYKVVYVLFYSHRDIII